MRKKRHHQICKNESRQFDSLIRVLRPKVFITDSSNFRKLVQELTGNGSPISSPPPIEVPVSTKNIQVIDIEDHPDQRGSSRETSVDGLVDSLELCNQLFLSPEEGISRRVDNGAYMDDQAAFEASKDASQREDPYRAFESWLLDGDESFSFFSGYAQTEQQKSVYSLPLNYLNLYNN
ncbi:hypothetical protein Tsubulata_019953 [Turnera subulata]|uniref:VQ domain-containing protein n=1 Tax=Turnera subulata TaxID=218843 RepID=A0A9Q0JRF1_9ROSI|nr:hypothetical protein Tsubulata_019953 [Turnera subulata]